MPSAGQRPRGRFDRAAMVKYLSTLSLMPQEEDVGAGEAGIAAAHGVIPSKLGRDAAENDPLSVSTHSGALESLRRLKSTSRWLSRSKGTRGGLTMR